MSKLLNVSEGGEELVPDSEAAVIDEGKNDAWNKVRGTLESYRPSLRELKKSHDVGVVM